jgi:hypothetical protein
VTSCPITRLGAYKQDAQVFTALGFYEELERVVFSHKDPHLVATTDVSAIEPNERAFVSVLRKQPKSVNEPI